MSLKDIYENIAEKHRKSSVLCRVILCVSIIILFILIITSRQAQNNAWYISLLIVWAVVTIFCFVDTIIHIFMEKKKAVVFKSIIISLLILLILVAIIAVIINAVY